MDQYLPVLRAHDDPMQSTAVSVRRPKSPPDSHLIEGMIGNLPLFRDLVSVRDGSFLKQCSVVTARRGDVIVQRGARMPGLFVVAYGTVKLSLRGGDGEERILRLVSSGETFGEATALLGRPARYEAFALGDCKLAMIPLATVSRLLEQEPRFARRLMNTLGERTLELIDEVEAATMQRGAQRLARYLQSLVGVAKTLTVIRLPVSKTLVAARLGVKKETLSRLLHQFVSDGLIEVTRREVRILDVQRLNEAAGGHGIFGSHQRASAKELTAAT